MTLISDRVTRKYGWLFLLDKLPQVLVAIGILVRIVVYFQNRSIFLDEANLALNIAEKSWPAFFRTLDYQQYAPPLFLCLEKCSIELFGTHEMAFRLVPLLAGILALVLFYHLVRQFIPSSYLQWLPIYLLAFSPMMIQYATEIKQYSSDILCTIFVFFLATIWRYQQLTRLKKILLSLLGATIVWFSMPSVFVLFGMGCSYFYQAYKSDGWKGLFYFLPVVGLWLISFAGYYVAILSTDLGKTYLLDYHRPYFFPLLPLNQEDLATWLRVLAVFFKVSIGGTVLAFLTGSLLFFAGIFSLIQKHKDRLILLCFPILASLLASALERYSLMPRLSLFLVPNMLLIMGIGFAHCWQKLPWVTARGLFLVFLVVVLANWKGYAFFWKKLSWENSREVLAFASKSGQSDDLSYISHELIPAYRYYRELHPDSLSYQLPYPYLARWDDQAVNLLEKFPKQNNFWLLYSHLINEVDQQRIEDQIQRLRPAFQIKNSLKTRGAAAYYLEKEIKSPILPERVSE